MTKEFAGTDEFTEEGNEAQGESKANAHTNGIKGGGNNAVFAGKSFCTAQNDAVNYNQGNEDTQRFIQGRNKGVHQHFQDGYEGCDDDDVSRDMDLIGNEFPDTGK